MTYAAKIPFLLASTLLLALLGCSDGGAPEAGAKGPRIAVVPKGTTHIFWAAVERGARNAESELGVEVIWKAQLEESDRAGQIQVVQQLANQGIDALCIAPLDAQALARPIADVRAKGIPVIVFDSMLAGEPGVDFLGYVGTDNLAAGRMGGTALAEKLGGKGKVVLLRYVVGSASTEAREQGFLEALAEHPGIEVTVSDRYAGSTSASAQAEALTLLPALRDADGVFCSNESATAGMLLALRREGLLDSLAFVGFDSSPPLLEGLRAGEIDALVVQDPVRMGAESVRLAKLHLDGGDVPKITDTGVVVVTRENLAEPRVRALVE